MEEEKRPVTDLGRVEAVLFRALMVGGPLSLLLHWLSPNSIKSQER
jgi:hypothetical protein